MDRGHIWNLAVYILLEKLILVHYSNVNIMVHSHMRNICTALHNINTKLNPTSLHKKIQQFEESPLPKGFHRLMH